MEPPAALSTILHPSRLLLVSESGQLRWLSPGQSLTVGRTLDCDVPLSDVRVSKRHARIVWRAGHDHPLVVDEGSTNGVWVNGRQVMGQQTLTPGALLVCGETRLALLPAWIAEQGWLRSDAEEAVFSSARSA